MTAPRLRVVVSTAEQQAEPLFQLEKLERRITSNDQAGLKARWESGKKLRELREANFEKTLEEIAEHLGVSQPELSFRMRFSESPEALINAINRGWSWYETTKNMAELVGRKRAPRQSKPSSPIVEEFRLVVRRFSSELRKIHAKDLREADFKRLDAIQEEIARIYDEVNNG